MQRVPKSPSSSDLLVVSDLHLSEGRHPGTGFLSRQEDFLFDREFSDFLDHHLEHPRWRDRSWKLVINGDFVDFLQVVSLPARTSGLDFDPLYGLACGEKESAWKLRRIVAGHWQLFQALARFACRHPVVIVPGNHDIEFWYPLVQHALTEELCRMADGAGHSSRAIVDHLSFAPWFFLDEDVYCEHGHQYDRLNSFTLPLEPRLTASRQVAPGREDHIDLPLGSLLVRYLFNRVEGGNPHADNVKPATRFIGWFLRHHPWRAARFLAGDGREMLRRIRRAWRRVPASSCRTRHESHRRRLAALARQLAGHDFDPAPWLSRLERLQDLTEAPLLHQRPGPGLRLVRRLTGPVLLPLGSLLLATLWLAGLLFLAANILQPLTPRLLSEWLPSLLLPLASLLPAALSGFLAELFRWCFLFLTLGLLGLGLRRRSSAGSALKPLLREKAGQIRQILDVRCVVMGHTHDPDLCPLDQGAEYFNTGTWTKVFSDEERLIREERELVFLRLLRSRSGEWSARLLKWEEGVSGGRLVHLFSSPDNA